VAPPSLRSVAAFPLSLDTSAGVGLVCWEKSRLGFGASRVSLHVCDVESLVAVKR